MRTLDYTLVQGEPWQRLIMVKDKRTRRARKLGSARSIMRLQGTSDTHELDVTISYEGGAMLCITYNQSLDLTPGVWDFDVVGDYRGQNEKISQGTITVEALSTITPLEGGPMITINYDQYTDYRKVFTWQDTDGQTIEVSDARLQAKDTQDAIVLDLAFAATPPDETAIGLLDPDKRGYLSPIVGSSLELHISEQAVIPAGTYTFDLLAQEAGGDWGRLSEGTLNVDAGVTDPTS